MFGKEESGEGAPFGARLPGFRKFSGSSRSCRRNNRRSRRCIRRVLALLFLADEIPDNGNDNGK